MRRISEFLLTNSRLDLSARWILGGVFIYASIHKIMDPASFAKIIYGYDILPHSLINLAAIILPFVECIGGLFLALGIWPRSAALIVNALLGLFIMAITFNLIRGHEFDCGCFSVSRSGLTSSSSELLVRDILWFTLGLVPILFRGRRLGLFFIKER